MSGETIEVRANEERDGVLRKDDGAQGVGCKSSNSMRRRKMELRQMKLERGHVGSPKRVCNSDSSSAASSSSSPSSGTLSPPSDSEADAKDGILEAKTPAACLSHGSVSLVGRRREMEDAVAIAPAFANSGSGYDFFGVYDGHGGARVAHACRERMHVVLAEEIVASAVEWADVEEGGRWQEAMAACFARVDGEASSAAGTAEVEAAERTVGSTAVVAVVGTLQIVVANCGDSRAVLSRAGVAIPLSSDHKPDRPDEMERVEAAGGRVINWDGYRVLGVLATSRSIGFA